MIASMRVSLLIVGLAALAACGPRQVEVKTAPEPTASSTSGAPSVQLTNNLSQAVNVYVTVTGGNELFLRQVAANTVEKVPVSGVATGSTVTFKAVTVDGSRTYQSRSSPLSALFLWSVP
jgi:ABC-type glycerol-3-phosphate transport system substrate-binding protein